MEYDRVIRQGKDPEPETEGNKMSNISAQGVSYETVEAAQARYLELYKLNAEIGPSDGRITEMNAITWAIQLHDTETARNERIAATGRPSEAVATLVPDTRRTQPTYADVVAEKPFYAYIRTAKGGKDIKRFKTRKALDSFMDRTPHAVTAHN